MYIAEGYFASGVVSVASRKRSLVTAPQLWEYMPSNTTCDVVKNGRFIIEER